MNKIVIAGGTGFIGTYLKLGFLGQGYEVLVVSRSKGDVSWNDADLLQAIEGSEMVINLAGKSINCRHNSKNKQAILDSRVNTTLKIGKAIERCSVPPALWINASATGIYLPSRDRTSDESDTQISTDFISDVVKRWEATFFSFQFSNTRQIALRTSVVLGNNGGAWRMLSRLACIGLGGKQADGKQIFSWVHIEDYFQTICFIMKQSTIEGIVNCTSPYPIANECLMREIRNIVHVRIGIPAPRIAIMLGAMVVGTEPSLILNSSNVVPTKLLDAGFQFKYPKIDTALASLLPM